MHSLTVYEFSGVPHYKNDKTLLWRPYKNIKPSLYGPHRNIEPYLLGFHRNDKPLLYDKTVLMVTQRNDTPPPHRDS